MAKDGAKEICYESNVFESSSVKVIDLLKTQNVIAYVKSGAAKSLVTQVVIGNLVKNRGVYGKSVILVNQLPQVTQYGVYIKRASNGCTHYGHYYGDLGLSNRRTPEWIQQLMTHDVVILTAKVFLNALRHALIPMDAIDLLIFDECHRAADEQVYISILRDFYHAVEEDNMRPRILGVTLQPLDNPATSDSDIQSTSWMTVVEKLEDRYDARFVTAFEGTASEVDLDLAKMKDQVLMYDPHPVWNQRERILSVMQHASKIEDADNRLFSKSLFSDMTNQLVEADATLICDYVEEQLGSLAAMLLKTEMLLLKNEKEAQVVVQEISNKASCLIEYLVLENQKWKELCLDSAFQCFIVVKRQCLAWCLEKLINYVIGGIGGVALYAKWFLSHHAQKNLKVGSLSCSEHRTDLEKFSRECTGIAIVTSLEEFDVKISPGAFVIMFDETPLYSSCLRTRVGGSHPRHIFLVPRCGLDGIRLHRTTRLAESASSLPPFYASIKNRNKRGKKKRAAFSSANQVTFLRSQTTAAIIPDSASKFLLARYCESLPQSDISFGEDSKPKYEAQETSDGFGCTVTLPFGSIVRCASAMHPYETSEESKAAAAFEAYKKLYERKAIDEFLLPHRASYLEGMQSCDSGDRSVMSFLYLRTKKTDVVVTGHLQQPEALTWGGSPPWRAYIYLISWERPLPGFGALFASSTKHALVTRSKILKEDLEALAFPSGEPLLTLEFVKSFTMTKVQYEQATEYVRRIQALCVNKAYKLKANFFSIDKPGFLLVPLQVSDGDLGLYDVAWTKIDGLNSYDFFEHDTCSICSGEKDWCKLEQKIVQSRHDKKAVIYFTFHLDFEMSPLSTFKSIICEELDCKNYQEYFEKRHGTKINGISQPMLQTVTDSAFKWTGSEKHFFVVPELCRIVPVEKYPLYLSELLPSWQRFMATKEAYRRLRFDQRGVKITSFARALTPAGNEILLSQNYERLEYLGDAVIKYFVCMFAFHVNGIDHEGLMSFYANTLLSNDNLQKLGLLLRLERVLAYTCSPISPLVFEYLLAPQEKDYHVTSKVFADAMEALVGVVYLEKGLTAIPRLLDDFGITKHLVTIMKEGFRSITFEPRYDERLSDDRLDVVEDILGYHFKDRLLLLEALTHPSFVSASTPSYQRLEFLGDAVLGIVITDHIYRAYPDLSPAELSRVRENAVSNDTFGLALIKLGLHKHIYHDSPALEADIKGILRRRKEKSHETDRVPISCPKSLGDIFEAIAGAIAIDSKNDITRIWYLLAHVLVPLLVQYSHPRRFWKHPVPRCTHMIQTLRKQAPVYRFRKLEPRKQNFEDIGESFEVRTLCEVLVHGKLVARAEGMNTKTAKRRAAEKVCCMLEGTYLTRRRAEAKTMPIHERPNLCPY